MASIVEATEAHIPVLAANLRECDLDETQATVGMDPRLALQMSLRLSDVAWTALDHDGVPMAMFGAARDTTQQKAGIVWLLGTDKMDELHHFVLRNSVPYMRKLHKIYPFLHNFVDARNTKTLRWLEWCGFTIISFDPEYGIEKRPFYQFARYENNV